MLRHNVNLQYEVRKKKDDNYGQKIILIFCNQEIWFKLRKRFFFTI